VSSCQHVQEIGYPLYSQQSIEWQTKPFPCHDKIPLISVLHCNIYSGFKILIKFCFPLWKAQCWVWYFQTVSWYWYFFWKISWYWYTLKVSRYTWYFVYNFHKLHYKHLMHLKLYRVGVSHYSVLYKLISAQENIHFNYFIYIPLWTANGSTRQTLF